jgi:hypothetical protein
VTRDRLFGSDVPFMQFVRQCDLLPSYSQDCGWVQTDVDSFIHRYLNRVDKQGTREVQCMMEIEVKTRQGNLTDSQIDTYRKKHATIIPFLKWNRQLLFNYGVSFVRMDGTSPADSQWMKWGRFKRVCTFEIEWRDICLEQLISLLRFDLNPDTLLENKFRRHHKTSTVVVAEQTPLGFVAERDVVNRS